MRNCTVCTDVSADFILVSNIDNLLRKELAMFGPWQIGYGGLPVMKLEVSDVFSRLRLKCYGTRTETRFRLSAKRMSPFKSAGASFQSTTGSRGVRISGSNAGYTMFRGSVKGTGYPLHSPVSPTFSLLCVNVCHHISPGLHLHFFAMMNI